MHRGSGGIYEPVLHTGGEIHEIVSLHRRCISAVVQLAVTIHQNIGLLLGRIVDGLATPGGGDRHLAEPCYAANDVVSESPLPNNGLYLQESDVTSALFGETSGI
jgi:hypothetical protein